MLAIKVIVDIDNANSLIKIGLSFDVARTKQAPKSGNQIIKDRIG